MTNFISVKLVNPFSANSTRQNLGNANFSTPVLSPPSAPVKAANTSAVQGPRADDIIDPTPFGLGSGLNISDIERPSRSFNGSDLRLERQNAFELSPERPTSPSNADLVDAIERNTLQLREMFGNLSQHVDDLEKRIGEKEKSDAPEKDEK